MNKKLHIALYITILSIGALHAGKDDKKHQTVLPKTSTNKPTPKPNISSGWVSKFTERTKNRIAQKAQGQTPKPAPPVKK